MACRHRLHHNHLERFKSYLIGKGWVIEEPKGEYEVLRARLDGRKRPLIIYTRLEAKEHYSVDDRDWRIISGFMNSIKGG